MKKKFLEEGDRNALRWFGHICLGADPGQGKISHGVPFFKKISSPELLDWFWWNLVGKKYPLSLTGVNVFRPDPPKGGSRAGQNRSRSPLLQETSSSDRKATATNWMHSNDLEACDKNCCYFWFHSEVKIVTRFLRLFGLSHFALF